MEKILQAAVFAPSNHNCQPWHFVVVDDAKHKKQLATAMGRAWHQDLLRAGTAAATADKLVNNSVQRFSQAPVLILGCVDETRLPRVPDFLEQEERQMGIQSTAMALFAAQLAAAQLGLATCWYCAPMYCPDVVVDALGLPPTLLPQALLVLGYPARPGRRRGRRPWHEATTFL